MQLQVFEGREKTMEEEKKTSVDLNASVIAQIFLQKVVTVGNHCTNHSALYIVGKSCSTPQAVRGTAGSKLQSSSFPGTSSGDCMVLVG